jgi:quinol monooxygenase YgiN
MAGKSLWVQMTAKPGKEAEVAEFLTGALPLVEDEPATRTWYALRIGESTFGIFDTFDDDEGRDAHLSGKVAEALMGRADELFSEPPQIDHGDVLAAKH